MATEKTLEVRGMDCTGCEHRLRTALKRLEGLIGADADYRTGRVKVRFDEVRLSEDDITERLRSSGYEVA